MREILRRYWHDLYYKMAPAAGVEFAMRCKAVAQKVDLEDPSETPREWFRFRLHLSLCQACSYYHRTSVALKQAVAEMLEESNQAIDLEVINEELVGKHAIPKSKPPQY